MQAERHALELQLENERQAAQQLIEAEVKAVRAELRRVRDDVNQVSVSKNGWKKRNSAPMMRKSKPANNWRNSADRKHRSHRSSKHRKHHGHSKWAMRCLSLR
jgi:hypothetical protein